MPRTKISKNKRERHQNDELMQTLKEIDALSDEFNAAAESAYQQKIMLCSSLQQQMIGRLPKNILQMKLGDLLALSINTIEECKTLPSDTTSFSKHTATSLTSSCGLGSKLSTNDEGYITEDAASSVNAFVRQEHITRPMGPLSSAKARSRPRRRSRSACTYFTPIVEMSKGADAKASATKQNPNLLQSSELQIQKDTNPQSVIRMTSSTQLRTKSADRDAKIIPLKTSSNPSVLRYPRLGETVVSLSGSPIVAHGLPFNVANINIPLKNDIISLRPAKVNEIECEIVQQIGSETLNQLKQLQENLNLIMKIASKDLK